MMTSLPSLLRGPATTLLALTSLASSSLAAPYTDWADDYTGTEAHTIGLWKFDGPNYGRNSATDPAYAHPDASFSTVGTQTGVAGKFGSAFLSNGPTSSTANNSNAHIADATLFNGSALTVEFWFSPLSSTPLGGASTGWLFDKMYSPPSVVDGISLQLISGGTGLSLWVGNGTSATSLNATGLTWLEGEWYHIAVTYENVNNDGLLKIYRNGELLASKTESNFGDLSAGSRAWRIGNRLGSSYSSVPGYYDNFRISDVAYEFAPVPEASVAHAVAAGSLLLASLHFRARQKKRRTA